MKIAVLAFGSLVNNLTSVHYGGTLDVEKSALPIAIPAGSNIRGDTNPFLPAEGLKLPTRLGRLSSAHTEKRRFTMVLHEGASAEQVYFAVSRKSTLEEAMANLAAREGLGPYSRAIGFCDLGDGSQNSRIPRVAERVAEWARGKFDAVIWTDLEGNIEFAPDSTGREILPLLANDRLLLANSQAYIRDLPSPPNGLQQYILGM